MMVWRKSFITLLVNLQQFHDSNTILQSSVIAMINEFYARHTTMHLIVEFNDSTFTEMLPEILSSCANLSFMIESIDNVEEFEVKRRDVMIFASNFKSLSQLFGLMTSTKFAFDGFYTIVMQTISDDNASRVFRSFWKKFLYNVNIITMSEYGSGFVVMKTFLPFRENACHQSDPIVINKFYEHWSERDFFPYKFRSFHNCTIRAGTFEYAPAVIRSENDESLHGSDIELMRGLQTILNFHLNLTFSEEPGAYGITYDNGTVTGLKVLLLDNELDLLFGLYYATYPNCKYMACSQPYFAVAITIIVPQRSLTSFQKFFVPFKLGLWIALALLLFIATLVIAIVEYKIKFARNFVIGGNVRNPYVQMITAFFGNSSGHLPRRNFARFLLMTFILFALIIRTVYIAGLFKFLQADTKVTSIKSVNDLVENEYKIYALSHFVSYLENMGLKSR